MFAVARAVAALCAQIGCARVARSGAPNSFTVSDVLAVSVVYSPRAGEVDEVLLSLREGATVADALRESGMAARHDTNQLVVGVWGRVAAPGDALRDRDRVELYRPLQVDPKEARRLRQHKQRGRLKR